MLLAIRNTVTGIGISADTVKFWREASAALSYINAEIYLRLSRGEELPFARGKKGQELTSAIIKTEQQAVQYYIDNPRNIFDDENAAATMSAVSREISNSPSGGFERWLTNDCIKDAQDNAFPNGGFDFSEMADRVLIGEELASIVTAPGNNC